MVLSDTDNRWRYAQVQDYLKSMLELNEADKKEFDSRTQEAKATVDGIKDKFIPVLGITTTIFLGLASLNIFKEIMIILMMSFIAVAIIWYRILTHFYNPLQIAYSMINAARYKSILRLVLLKEIFTNMSIGDTEISKQHLKNVFIYIKLVGMSKFELLEEYKRASKLPGPKGQSVYFSRMAMILEGTINDALTLYSSNKEIFRKDQEMDIYELQLASFFGGETLFEQFERLLSSLKRSQFKSEELGLIIELPGNWVTEPVSEKIKKHQKLEKTVLKARPLSGTIGRVGLTVKTLDISNPSVYPTKSLSEIVKFQLGMLDSTTDTTLEDIDITVNQYSAHKIVYISRFKTLTDKLLKVWLVANGIAYEISYEAPNAVLYDLYYDDIVRIIDSFKITK